MTDQPGAPGEPTSERPEERLPARRPPSEAAPANEAPSAARFSGPPSSRTFGLTPERAAGIVRQSSNARWVGLLATTIVVLFVIVYYFYDLGVPGVANTSRLSAEATDQQVTMVERGYNIFQANCARCHGDQGQGGIGPVLNDQAKLYSHLTPSYIQNVLTVGGRYVCGNAKSVMPVWADVNGGPLNYIQIQEVIAFIRATSDQTFVKRDPTTDEPLTDASGNVQTFTGWRDPSWTPAPSATPVPDCWSSVFTSSASPAASGSPGASAAPGASAPPGASGSPGASTAPGASGSPAPSAAVTLDITAQNIAFDKTDLEVAANTAFAIQFDNQDSGVPHNVAIKDANGQVVFAGEIFSGVDKRTYQVPALKAGTYTFFCQVHPNMTGTLTVK